MEQKTSESLIEFAKSKLKTSYAYGAKGEILTEALLQCLINENPKVYTESYIKKTRKNLNQICVDCSGLISWHTGIIRGSRNYYDTALTRLPIHLLDETMIGWAVWKSGHIGIYVGNGICIEANGVDRGVISTEVKKGTWEYVLKLCDIDYTQVTELPPIPVIKDGWIKESEGWRFYKTPTTFIKNQWMTYENSKYWFDGNGYAITEQWYQSNGNWYYFGADRKMQTGLKEIEGHLYYLKKDGSMLSAGKILILRADENGALSPVGGNPLWELLRLLGGK